MHIRVQCEVCGKEMYPIALGDTYHLQTEGDAHAIINGIMQNMGEDGTMEDAAELYAYMKQQYGFGNLEFIGVHQNLLHHWVMKEGVDYAQLLRHMRRLRE